ncbi:sterol desaturase family protein [Novosphingobium bradum]|uniref:Sterol desaturase family protein n=1 Tax=Novosphingobium bradum TaxID=1737444 RepID=A0ABV7IL73_9SPHN
MSPVVEWLHVHYQWQLSLIVFATMMAINIFGKHVANLVPAFRAAGELNMADYRRKLAKPSYAANLKRSRKWGLIYNVITFLVVIPFCVGLAPTPWWKMLVDVVIILMVYDFFYYMCHRFLFHDEGFLGGPLLAVHAVHHRQHNPCRNDSAFLNPLETAIGIGLYVGSLALLSVFMGPFHLVTVLITFFAFQQINLHNHDLWEEDRFPFRYLNYAAKMHHNHHAVFTGGNFGTISLFYDWLFGTMDDGKTVRRAGGKKA